MTTISVRLDQLEPTYKTREENPNKMPDSLFDLLVQSIEHDDFLQPILVRLLPSKKYKIVDGHHRYWAAEKAGLKSIDAVLLKAKQHKGVAIGIGMNKRRGDLDLTMVSDSLKEIAEKTKWNHDELALLTGFTQSEIADLVETSKPDVEELMEEVGSAPPEESEEPPSKPYVLEVKFETKEQYQLAKRKLRKAAGKAKDLGIGLLNVLGDLDEFYKTK